MRSRLESFFRGIDPALARSPSELVSQSLNEEVQALKETYLDDDLALARALDGMTDEVSRVFGAPWQASKLNIRDLVVKPETWFDQYQERDGVSIDRDTETALDGRLYNFQVVPAGVEFEFRAIFENADDTVEGLGEVGYWELGMLMVGLQQFKMQQIPLGGGCSRGLGVVELDIDKLIWIDPEGSPQALLDYMQRLSQGDLSHYERDSSHIEALKEDWTSSLVNYLSGTMQTRVPVASEV